MDTKLNKKQLNHQLLYSLLTIVVVTLIIYANSIGNGYNMDDSLVMTNNSLIDFGNWKSIFTQYSYQSSEYNFAYRPLCVFSFYLENLLFGKSPQVSHLINLILYLLLNFTVFFLLVKVSNNLFSSLIITLLFVSFPLHTEVVDNIKNRDELFVAIVGFLALYFTICSIIARNKYHFLLIFVFSFLGILFKETFIIFPFIIAFSAVFFYWKPSFREKVIVFIKYLTISGSAIVLNFIFKFYFLDKTAINREFEFFENPLFFSTIAERILPSIYIIGYYISLLFSPFQLSYYYGYNTINYHDYFSLNFILGALFLISIPIIIFYHNKKNKLLIIGIIVLVINLLAISNFIKPLVGIVSERFILNGSLGFCIVLYFLLQSIVNYLVKENYHQKILLIVFSFVIVSYSIKTITRNNDWESELSLYAHDIKNVPTSVKANEMLAGSYYKMYFEATNINYLNTSEKYYLKTIAIYPQHAASLNNLGTINYIKKNYKNAIEYFQKSLLLKDKPQTHYNLALCYSAIGAIRMAKKEYEITLIAHPEVPNLVSTYKQFVITNKLIPESIVFIEKKLLKKNKNNLTNYLLLIDFYNELNDYQMMLSYLKRANQINPNANYQNYMSQLESYLKNKQATKSKL
ncbi:MAG: hypothetical protein CO118_03600 [Flavobacteriales bacterium CG_4_9_14_3_um_filter_32_8]|nr:MAG: hypothetical protein CO118_03600 [Flavobacteriales bacterium CG_4_9_14_3_um_filter_32_8]